MYTAALQEHFGRHLSGAQARALEAALRPVHARTRDSRRAVAYRSRRMIKYIGSKRRLVPVLGELASTVGGAHRARPLHRHDARRAGAQAAAGCCVTAVDSARYAEVFAQCYIATDAAMPDTSELAAALRDLEGRPGVDGYVTETFCVQSRFFQPFNGRRIDAIRDAIEVDYRGSPLAPLLLTSLIEAADRVDSTTGVQMAYVKQWAPRSFRPLELRGAGAAVGPGPGRARRRLRRGGRAGFVRLRVSRPALQPASVLHELPHLGDAGRVGRARALRRRVQAARRARTRRPAACSTSAGGWRTPWRA